MSMLLSIIFSDVREWIAYDPVAVHWRRSHSPSMHKQWLSSLWSHWSWNKISAHRTRWKNRDAQEVSWKLNRSYELSFKERRLRTSSVSMTLDPGCWWTNESDLSTNTSQIIRYMLCVKLSFAAFTRSRLIQFCFQYLLFETGSKEPSELIQ
jgi:hypothetical protein